MSQLIWHWLDVVLIALVVTLSAVYAVYALSSVRIKRLILSRLVSWFGMRVFSVFSPRISGCNNCEAGARPDLRKLKS